MLKPHLCCDADLDKMVFPAICFPKIDGHRGINLGNGLTTRLLTPFANRHITGLYSNPLMRGFDGELCASHVTDKFLCSKTTSAMNTINGYPNVTWHLFDYITEETQFMPYTTRLEKLHEVRNKLIFTRPEYEHLISIVEGVEVFTKEQVIELTAKWIAEGYEGSVTRKKNGLHKNGRCTAKEANYVRLKNFKDDLAVVIGVTEAQENLNAAERDALGHLKRSSHQDNKIGKAMIGSLVCYSEQWGQFLVGPGEMTHDLRVYYFHNQQEIIGKTIKYQYLATGVKKKPRMPTFKLIIQIEG